jgi:hypothetical protein
MKSKPILFSASMILRLEFRRSEKAGMGDDEPDLRHADLKDDEEG